MQSLSCVRVVPTARRTSFCNTSRTEPHANCTLLLLDSGSEGNVLVGEHTLKRYLQYTASRAEDVQRNDIVYRFGAGSKPVTRTVQIVAAPDLGGKLCVDVVEGELPFLGGVKFSQAHGIVMDFGTDSVFCTSSPGKTVRCQCFTVSNHGDTKSLWLSLDIGLGISLSNVAPSGAYVVGDKVPGARAPDETDTREPVAFPRQVVRDEADTREPADPAACTLPGPAEKCSWYGIESGDSAMDMGSADSAFDFDWDEAGAAQGQHEQTQLDSAIALAMAHDELLFCAHEHESASAADEGEWVQASTLKRKKRFSPPKALPVQLPTSLGARVKPDTSRTVLPFSTQK